ILFVLNNIFIQIDSVPYYITLPNSPTTPYPCLIPNSCPVGYTCKEYVPGTSFCCSMPLCPNGAEVQIANNMPVICNNQNSACQTQNGFTCQKNAAGNSYCCRGQGAIGGPGNPGNPGGPGSAPSSGLCPEGSKLNFFEIYSK